MAKNSKQTSKAVASKASKILRDRRYSANAKSVAASALAQTKPGRIDIQPVHLPTRGHNHYRTINTSIINYANRQYAANAL